MKRFLLFFVFLFISIVVYAQPTVQGWSYQKVDVYLPDYDKIIPIFMYEAAYSNSQYQHVISAIVTYMEKSCILDYANFQIDEKLKVDVSEYKAIVTAMVIRGAEVAYYVTNEVIEIIVKETGDIWTSVYMPILKWRK